MDPAKNSLAQGLGPDLASRHAPAPAYGSGAGTRRVYGVSTADRGHAGIGPGASLEAIAFLREKLPSDIKIKASGGIRDRQFAEALVSAGADRLGCSASIQIVTG